MEGVEEVLFVEEQKDQSQREGKISENAARSERDTARLECSSSDEVAQRSTNKSCELRPQRWQEGS